MHSRHTPGQFAPVRDEHVPNAVQQELFQIAGVRAHATLAAKRQVRADSAFDGRVNFSRTHGEVYGQPVVRPWVFTHGDKLEQDQHVLGFEYHLSCSLFANRE